MCTDLEKRKRIEELDRIEEMRTGVKRDPALNKLLELDGLDAALKIRLKKKLDIFNPEKLRYNRRKFFYKRSKKQPKSVQFLWRDHKFCNKRWARKKAGRANFKARKKKRRKKTWLRWWQKRKKYKIQNSKYPLRRLRLYNKWRPHPRFKKLNRIKFYFKKSLGLIFSEKEKVIERMSKKIFKKKKKVTKFIKKFDCRLDNTLYKSTFGSLRMCRQWVNKGYVLVNNKTKQKPNFFIKENDIISISEKGMPVITYNIVKRFEKTFWRIDVRKGYRVNKPKGFNRKKFRKYTRFKFSRIPWSRFFLYFNNYPKYLITNFKTLNIKLIKGNPNLENLNLKKIKSSNKIAQTVLGYFGDKS